ncbi:5,6-dimethylbenzimidazole synthase [Brevibacillus centrosporus]|uniref:Cob(II)yrinic acid a,c-diamide reductase n=1 Tax=Brevibacillus centrosporus TaxID=54910 RepID=A0A1I3KRR3_9BACL|nr:5,6-dimethylbenzimidazole synthase [Brevibacillus centrosporus]MEC2129874.1 5,6-dimethylbenzimidazole synthase [Brevibacillus centrosporus]MED4907169.1 5,6-dimethylbenzimidazole synthase [Brevibacillus centrosporus]RNB71815.1 5,6-dimethylbenzimidazole synthase [Brevibacillus centrosporus]SFI75199.1 cob(II)yrinic acid a,c-diamide reductase [Brevibacillus centrosporus]GED34496.1 nitroreductase [Brevibacillus centrosporus]
MIHLTEEEKIGLYKAISNRRDIRSFRSDSIESEKLSMILSAAHHAPSVGFMQPWNFILVTADSLKRELADSADKERRALAIHYEGTGRESAFLELKIQGIKEAPVTICVTCDPTRGGDHVLGRNSIPETDIMSVSCAIQNMWLAAYAEGLAMGWVSFYKKSDVRRILDIPPHIDPVALLSIGYTDHYPDRPLLEIHQWEKRQELQKLIFRERWGQSSS